MDASRDQKQEIKFRVTSKITGQKPWSEKWAVKMGDGEEFIVTDEILKFPTSEITGRVVCTFSLVNEKLQFEYRDQDRPCTVSGNPLAPGASENLPVTEGDQIDIGEGIRIEVVKAPALPKKNAQEQDGPSVPMALTGQILNSMSAEAGAASPLAPMPEIYVPEETVAASLAEAEPTMQSSASIRLENEEPRARTNTGVSHPHTESRPENSSFTTVGESLSSEEADAAHAARTPNDAGSDSGPSHTERTTDEGSGEVHQMHTTSTLSPVKKKAFDFRGMVAPIRQHLRDTFADRNTRVAAIGALAIMGGVLVWKSVNNGKYASMTPSRSIAESAGGRYDGGRVQVDPLQPGVPIAEIQGRIPQIDALSDRLRARAAAPVAAPAAQVAPSGSRVQSYPASSGHSSGHSGSHRASNSRRR